jgi:Fe-S oxidoreductase
VSSTLVAGRRKLAARMPAKSIDRERRGDSVLTVHRTRLGALVISTGQLGARQASALTHTIKALRPALEAGWSVVVLEPSLQRFRSDAVELLGTDEARLLAKQTKTLAEILTETGWQPPQRPEDGPGRSAIAQVHCHEHAIMGFAADQKILRAAGVQLDVLDSGCCGQAGNFGFERGHYDVSAGAPSTAVIWLNVLVCFHSVEKGPRTSR